MQGWGLSIPFPRIRQSRSLSHVAVHVNFFPMARPDGFDMNRLDAFERDCVRRMETAQKWEFGYMNEQATKSERLGSTV